MPREPVYRIKQPVRPQGTAGHNAAVRGSSVICVVYWPQFIRFVDSDSHLSGLMGLSLQPFCAHFPMDLVFRRCDESALSLRADANGNKDCCLLICQKPLESASHPKLLSAVWAFGRRQLLQMHCRVVWVCLTKASKSPTCWVNGVSRIHCLIKGAVLWGQGVSFFSERCCCTHGPGSLGDTLWLCSPNLW